MKNIVKRIGNRAAVLLAAGTISAACSESAAVPEVAAERLDCGKSFCCRALEAVTDSVVWASGSGGTVLRTADGGKSWKECPVPSPAGADFRCLHAWNADSALVFAIGNPASAYKTSDGGDTWRQVYYKEMPGIFINSVDFKDARCGVAVGDQIDGRFYLLHTEDGGEHWGEIPAPEGEKGEGGFAASNRCIQYLPSGKIVFITGVTRSYFYTAADSTFDWKKYATGIVSGAGNGCDGIYSVYMLDDMRGWTGGGNYRDVEKNQNVTAITRDGGESWYSAETAPHGFVSCLVPFPEGDGRYLLAVGSDGYSFSSDGGINWKVLSREKGYHTASAAPGGKYIFAAGDGGRMARFSLEKNAAASR